MFPDCLVHCPILKLADPEVSNVNCIKDDDLFVVQSDSLGGVCKYTGQQFKDDINKLYASKGVEMWVQDSLPEPIGSVFPGEKDFWYDTSIQTLFVGVATDTPTGGGPVLSWAITNPADRENLLYGDSAGGVEQLFPHGTTHGQEWTNPYTGATYYYRAIKNQWVDTMGGGEKGDFVDVAGDTMTGDLYVPNLFLTGYDSVTPTVYFNEHSLAPSVNTYTIDDEGEITTEELTPNILGLNIRATPIVSYANGLYFIGGETGKLFYTDDPYNQDGWTTTTVSGPDPAYSVIYVDNRYVCIGRTYNAWSDDLVTWTKVRHYNNNLKFGVVLDGVGYAVGGGTGHNSPGSKNGKGCSRYH